jgi:hypothetical protein
MIMAAEYIDANIPMNCGECDLLVEGVPAMEQHIREAHPTYTPQQVVDFVRDWADNAYEQIDAHNIWRTEEYRRTGVDPDEADRDD